MSIEWALKPRLILSLAKLPGLAYRISMSFNLFCHKFRWIWFLALYAVIPTWSSQTFAQTTLVGISGGSASGKSTLTEGLFVRLSKIGLKTCVFSQDRYFDSSLQDPSLHVFIENIGLTISNYDHPSCMDFNRMETDLLLLLEGKEVQVPIIEYNVPKKSGKTDPIGPCDIVLMEGIHTFTWDNINKLIHLRIFVSHPEEGRQTRRIIRDEAERAVPQDETREIFEKIVKPMHDQYVEPQSKHADRIIEGHQTRSEALLDDLVAEILEIKQE
jgi:uridine kinase